MKEKTKILVISLLLITFFSESYARSCNGDQCDKVEYFSEQAGKIIVDKYGGGNDIRIDINSCTYNAYSGIFKVKIELYWTGLVFRNNTYNIDGELKMKADGSQVEFSETYANANVKDIRFWGYVVGGVIVLGAMSAESN